MKKETWVYLFGFLGGVILINIFGDTAWVNGSALNRYSLASVSFRNIVYEEYFIRILLLRFRTMAGLWVLSKLFPKKMIVAGYAICVSIILGGIAAMSIMANGLWGILFYFSIFMPHILFYGAAYMLWSNLRTEYTVSGDGRKHYFKSISILILVLIGCICEAFICPVLVEHIK